jgi:hypothetical protein
MSAADAPSQQDLRELADRLREIRDRISIEDYRQAEHQITAALRLAERLAGHF